ncbi:hypothetical protein CBR_g983 [Chara braunii]|uniref:DUF7906 domain-containing protein n=1 Tax=Chara braunii TaxID=69332 RepID=A0A388KD42_CHABU|nr:hypothetical protein CBR_g983 [Chara braunii]|eukprot:GBG67863.1 hypothetical protein CBR_g983 [Chara braunii]
MAGLRKEDGVVRGNDGGNWTGMTTTRMTTTRHRMAGRGRDVCIARRLLSFSSSSFTSASSCLSRSFFFLLALFILFLASQPLQAEAMARPSNVNAMLNLFKFKGNNNRRRIWDGLLFRRSVDDWERSKPKMTKDLETRYHKSKSVAEFLGLEEVDAMYLPVPINFIFVGFSKDGNHGLEITGGDITHWFAHMDHMLQHSRVPHAREERQGSEEEKKNSGDGRGRGGGAGRGGGLTTDDWEENVDMEDELPPFSFVHHNYSCHAIDVGQTVTDLFESAIHVLARKEDPMAAAGGGGGGGGREEHEGAVFQVDVDAMVALMDSLVEELDLKGAYNVFVLNPKLDWLQGVKYGYRSGLSGSELKLLAAKQGHHETVAQLIKNAAKESPAKILGASSFGYSAWGRRKGAKRPNNKFLWKLVESVEVADWVREKKRALDRIQAMAAAAGGGGGGGGDDVTKGLAGLKAGEILKENTEHGRALRRLIEDNDVGLHGDCLVDAWVSEDRVAFVDLSAGPFHWGPMIKGQGVRALSTLPSLDNIFDAVEQEPAKGVSEEEAAMELELERITAERFNAIKHEGKEKEEGGNGGEAQYDAAHDAEMLMAEMDVYEMFAERHCVGRTTPVRICEELSRRVEDMKEEVKRLDDLEDDQDGRKGAAVARAMEKIHSWSAIFGTKDPSAAGGRIARAMEGDHPTDAAEEEEEEEEEAAGTQLKNQDHAAIVRDVFMSQVGAILSNVMKQVVTPPTSSGSFHIHNRVTFHVYILHPHGPVDKEHAFLVDDFKREVTKLRVPSQEFRFIFHKLGVAEDTALGVAFTSSIRMSAVPLLGTNGFFEPSQVSFIDSLTLQHQLQRLAGIDDTDGSGKGGPGGGSSYFSFWNLRDKLDVPIFVFSLHRSPLLIDKQYTAKSLNNMVLVVQSDEPDWASNMQCNRERMHVDLRNPLKSAVAAVAEHLTGVLPSHQTFSHSHGKGTQDWMWAVGSHALAATSRGWKLSQIHVEAGWRNYVIVQLDEALRNVNEGIRILAGETTAGNTFKVMKEVFGDVETVMSEYSMVINSWHEIIKEMDGLHFDRVFMTLGVLDSSSRSFLTQCRWLATVMHPVRCAKNRTLNVGGLLPVAGIASTAVAGGLYLFLRRRKPKPKIN